MKIESTHHLDIEDLLAVVDGTLLDEEAQAHLATCSLCGREAQGWTTVALGVRHLAAAVAPPSTPLFDQAGLTSPDHRVPSVRQTRVQRLAGRHRRQALVAAAATVLLVIGAGSYGLSMALGGGRPAGDRGSTTLAAGLSAVSGCSALVGTSGTLEQVNGSDLVIMTSSGQSVSVTTTPSTNIGREASGTLGDITNGTKVIVNGTASDGTIDAATVGVGAIGTVKMMPPSVPSGLSTTSLAAGTVADSAPGGFSVIEPNGTHVAVTTSSSTNVVTLSRVGVDQLQVGASTVAFGAPGQGGTLAASRVEQGEAISTSGLPKAPPTFGQNKGMSSTSRPSADCSASGVATTALLLAN